MSAPIGLNARAQARLRGMVEELCALEEGLTDWEAGFVDEMDRRESAYTDGQARKIEQIYEERC